MTTIGSIIGSICCLLPLGAIVVITWIMERAPLGIEIPGVGFIKLPDDER